MAILTEGWRDNISSRALVPPFRAPMMMQPGSFLLPAKLELFRTDGRGAGVGGREDSDIWAFLSRTM